MTLQSPTVHKDPNEMSDVELRFAVAVEGLGWQIFPDGAVGQAHHLALVPAGLPVHVSNIHHLPDYLLVLQVAWSALQKVTLARGGLGYWLRMNYPGQPKAVCEILRGEKRLVRGESLVIDNPDQRPQYAICRAIVLLARHKELPIGIGHIHNPKQPSPRPSLLK